MTVAVAVEARSRGRKVEVERIEAEAAGGRAWGSGRYDAVSDEVALTLTARGLDWQRLPLFPEWAEALTGSLSGEVQLAGTTSAPTGQLRISLDEPRVRDHELPPVSLEARFDGRELRVAGKADVVFLRGHAALEGDWPLRLEVDLHALPLQPLLEAFPAAREANATLDASGTLLLELPLRELSRLRYSSPDLAVAGRIRGLDWRIAPFALRGDRESLELDGPRLQTGDAWLGAQGRVALSEATAFDLRLDAHMDLGALHAALPEAGLDGDLELKLQVSGARESPTLDGAVRLSDVRGRVAGVPWDKLDLVARFASGQVQLETLRASLLGGELNASGGFPLDRTAGKSALRFELRDLDLARLTTPKPSQTRKPLALVVSLDGEVRAAAPSLDQIAGAGRLTRLEARSADGSLGLAAPAAWSLEAGRLDVSAIRLAGPLGALETRVEAQLAEPLGFSATVKGGADLRAFNPFLDGVALAGPARVDLRVAHAPSGSKIEGGVTVEGARVSLEELQIVATDLGGALRFDGERVALEATAAVGDGTLRLHGGMRLGPALVGPVELTLEADRIPIQHPPGFRGRASGALTLAGDPGRYRLGGAVRLNQSYFTGQLDARAQALDRLAWQLAALDGGPLNQVALDVRLRLEEPLRIRNSRIQLDAEGAVQAGGTLAQPTASGHVTLRDGGEVTLGRARVRVTGGRIELNNHPAGTPEVDFQGHTRVSGVAMDIRARGPLDDLQLTLSSDQAELTQADLVTLMLTGRTASAAASAGGVVVAEQLAMALGGVLQRGVGDTLLIDVSPERSLLSDDTDPTQRFNIGTRVTQNVSVIYSAALDGTGQRWIVELNPGGGRFRFRAITEEDNSLSLEATARLAFDLWNRGRRGPAQARAREPLADLRFEGVLPIPEPELRGAARLRTGGRYSWLHREQAADRVQHRLVGEGYRQASVTATSLESPAGVELVLHVEAGPRVTLAWTGDDPGRRARQEGEDAWLSFSTPEAAAGAVARAALWRLQSQRFFEARVEPQLSAGDGRLDVRLHVTRGAQGSGVDIAFEGNTALADQELAAGLPSPGSPAFFEMLDVRSSRISSELRLAYAGIGHLQAKVDDVHSAVDSASGRLRVAITVSEGAPSIVLGIELPAEASDPGGPRLALAVGQPFDIAAYTADREALAAWYRGQGFIDAEVRAALEPEKGGVRVRFLVDPGPQPRVGDTRIAQTGRTREKLIERSLTLGEGDPVKPDALAESRERLWELGLFRSVEVTAEPRPEDDTVRDLQVSLVDRPDVSVEFGLRYTTAGEGGSAGGPPSTPEGGQFQVAGAVEFNSPLGFGGRTRAYGSATRERESWGFSLDAATLAGRRVRTQLFVFSDDDDHRSISGLASHVKGVSLQQSRVLLRDRRSRRWHDRLRLQWGYVFKDIEYAASARDSLLLQGDRGFLSVGAIGDERDSLTDPKRGVFWTANTELARTSLGSDVDYLRLYGQLFAYVPVGPLVWAQGYRFGSVPGENPLLLLENRFYAGGPTTVRGFGQNDLGGVTLEGDSLGGQAVAILNQELRFPIWKSLQGGAFWDAGNAWLTSEDFDLGDLRQSVGFGLRYVFPFGPIRLEYAWILGRRPGEPRGRFVFGLGHAF